MDTFLILGQFFHQDVFVIYPSLDGAIFAFIENISQGQREDLKLFLEVALDSKTDDELETLWETSGSDIYVAKKKIRTFLEEIYRSL